MTFYAKPSAGFLTVVNEGRKAALKTFTPKIDVSYRLITAFSGTAALAGLILWVVWGGWLIGSMLTLGGGIAFATALAQVCRTCYTLDEGSLDVRSGISKITVFYSDMVEVTTHKDAAVHGYVPMALSKDVLYIIYRQDDKNYRLELSPADRQGFLDALAQKAPHLCG